MPSGAQPIVDGFMGLACFGEMMRQQFRLGLHSFPEPLLQCLRDSVVMLMTRAFQERLVSGVLQQCMLELVGHVRG